MNRWGTLRILACFLVLMACAFVVKRALPEPAPSSCPYLATTPFGQTVAAASEAP